MRFGNLYGQTLYSIAIITLYVSIGFIVHSCANISAPSGGIKDVTKPKVLSSYPTNLRTNFKGKRIVINFDEKMDVSKLKEKIIISPATDNEFEVDARGKSVIIEFKRPLSTAKDTLNRTYTIDFSDGLKDVNEGNTIPHYKLVFSTGNRIDSGRVSGLLTDAYSKDSVQNASVALYIHNDTLNIQKHKPEYYAISNAKGKYSLENIKKGEYQLFAFIDKNKNQIADVQTEKLAFLDHKILVSNTDTAHINLELSKNDLKVPKLLSSKNDDQYTLIFDEGIYEYDLKSKEKLYHIISPNRKNIIIYKNDLCEDSINIDLNVKDSAFNDTTYHIKIVQNTPKKITRYKDIIKAIDPPNNTIIHDSIVFKLAMNDPVIYERDSAFIINTDSASFRIIRLNKDFKSDNSNTIFTYIYKIRPKPKRFIEMIIKSNKMGTSKGDTNAAYKYKYILPTPVDESEISKIGININTKEPNYYVELLSEKHEILDRKHNPKKIIYKDLKPGTYSIRLFADPNRNGKWDNGNFTKHLQPERVKVYKKLLVVIKNWDIEDTELDF